MAAANKKPRDLSREGRVDEFTNIGKKGCEGAKCVGDETPTIKKEESGGRY